MYCLIEDDEDRWFICPTDKVKEAEYYFKLVQDYWHDQFMNSYEQSEYEDCPIQPTYLIPIQNPSSVLFKEFKLRDSP